MGAGFFLRVQQPRHRPADDSQDQGRQERADRTRLGYGGPFAVRLQRVATAFISFLTSAAAKAVLEARGMNPG